MLSIVMADSRTLARHCHDGICHCDWRLTIKDCEESTAMWYIYVVNIALSALVIVVGIALFSHRVFIKGHRLWDFHTGRGCLRPKPVDCMLFLLITFNILRMISSIFLVADIAPNNLTARSFLFEIPWQFGYGGFALYLVGIAQTLAESHKAISTGWLPSARTVDLLGSWFFLSPFVFNNICSLLAGGLAYRDLYAAEVFTRLLYGFWFLHDTSLSFAVFFAGLRLVRILSTHLQKFSQSGPRYAAVKTGIFKIQMIVGIIIVCLMMFASFLLLYGILRDQIMTSTAGSVFLSVIWTYLGPLATVFVEAAIIINPSMKNPALGSSLSSNDQSGGGYTSYDNQNSTIAAETMDFTKSENIHNELSEQQAQYQQVFQKHAVGKVVTAKEVAIIPMNTLQQQADLDDQYEYSESTKYYNHNNKKRTSEDGSSSKMELMMGS